MPLSLPSTAGSRCGESSLTRQRQGTPPVPEWHRWVFLKPTGADEERNLGFSLPMLCFMLFGSLSNSAVLLPDMPAYLNQRSQAIQWIQSDSATTFGELSRGACRGCPP